MSENPLIYLVKEDTENLELIFENNYFENIYYPYDGFPITLHSEKLFMNNITFINSTF